MSIPGILPARTDFIPSDVKNSSATPTSAHNVNQSALRGWH